MPHASYSVVGSSSSPAPTVRAPTFFAWTSVDLDGAKLTVERSLVSVDFAVGVRAPKTTHGRRVIALDSSTVSALKAHRSRQLDERLATGELRDNELDLVFAREDGTPLHPQAFSETFERHVMAAKLPKLNLQGLRHTHATLALRAGVHPKVVSERLGHASVAFTLDEHTDALPDIQETAAGLVTALVLEPASENGWKRPDGRVVRHSPEHTKAPLRRGFVVAAGQGFEPQLPDPESGVLPLDDPATVGGIVAGAEQKAAPPRRCRATPRPQPCQAFFVFAETQAPRELYCFAKPAVSAVRAALHDFAALRSAAARASAAACAFADTHLPIAFASAFLPFALP